MANYYATARSNYFRVRDEAAFTRALEPFDVRIIRDPHGRIGLLSEAEAGWESWIIGPDDEDIEVDVLTTISAHLQDGEVAIIIEVGFEKMRYLTGYARAVNSRGEERSISLSDIYDRARELGDAITAAEY